MLKSIITTSGIGREPLPEEIAIEMNIPVQVREIMKISQEPVSLRHLLGGRDSQQ